jgi:hypothetical protein
MGQARAVERRPRNRLPRAVREPNSPPMLYSDIDAQLLSSRTRYKFKRVEDVEYNIGGEFGSLTALGNLFLGRLSTALACPILTNPYRASAPGGVMRHG